MRNVIAAFDRAAMRRFAETDCRFLDLVRPRLSRAANHGLLRIAVAAGLWATSDRWVRRAAWRGLAVTGAMIRFGVAGGTAVVAVVAFRLVTYWLPCLPGAVAFRMLRRQGSL